MQEVLRHRPTDADHNSPGLQYQVKWLGYDPPSDCLKADEMNCAELLSAYWENIRKKQRTDDVGRMVPQVVCLPLQVTSIACLCCLTVLLACLRCFWVWLPDTYAVMQGHCIYNQYKKRNAVHTSWDEVMKPAKAFVPDKLRGKMMGVPTHFSTPELRNGQHIARMVSMCWCCHRPDALNTFAGLPLLALKSLAGECKHEGKSIHDAP